MGYQYIIHNCQCRRLYFVQKYETLHHKTCNITFTNKKIFINVPQDVFKNKFQKIL